MVGSAAMRPSACGTPAAMRAVSGVCGIADIDLAAGDVEGAAVQGEGFGQSGQRMLARGIGRGIGPGHLRRNRAVVDDAPAARIGLRLHQPYRFLRAEERPGQIDADHRLPFVETQFFQRRGTGGGPGVVEQQIQAAEAVLDPGEKLLDR